MRRFRLRTIIIIKFVYYRANAGSNAGGVPEVAREVLVAGRQAAQGRAAGGPARHGQDAAGARRGGRGPRALLPRRRARVRRDPGGAGRAPRARPVQ